MVSLELGELPWAGGGGSLHSHAGGCWGGLTAAKAQDRLARGGERAGHTVALYLQIVRKLI